MRTKPPHQQTRTQAFTLLELLVVVAIIALLAAILFPVFQRAREKARQTSCMSNLKQLGLGFIQYTQDWDERMPSGRYGYQGDPDYCNWPYSIYPYVRSKNAFTCPDDATPATTFNVQGTPVPISYILNFWAVASTMTNYTPTSITAYRAPSLTYVLMECYGNYNDPSYFITSFSNEPGDCFQGDGAGSEGLSDGKLSTGPLGGHTFALDPSFPTGRHSDGSSYLFADGHVKWLLGNTVSSGREPQPNAIPQSLCAQDETGCIYGGPSYYSSAGTGNMTGPNGLVFQATSSKL